MRHTQGLPHTITHTCTLFHPGNKHNKDVEYGWTPLERAHERGDRARKLPLLGFFAWQDLAFAVRALPFCDSVAPAL